MKTFLLIALIFKMQFLLGQSVSDTPTVKVGLEINNAKVRDGKIVLYADSLNNLINGVLPDFIFNQCFDLQRYFWQDLHHPISLRWEVLEKVNNKNALKQILGLKDKRLKIKCDYVKNSSPELTIPMISKSFYQLVRKRYKEIK